MRIKRTFAPTMRDALLLVKQDFGIVGQRQRVVLVQVDGSGCGTRGLEECVFPFISRDQVRTGVPIQHKGFYCMRIAVARCKLNRLFR